MHDSAGEVRLAALVDQILRDMEDVCSGHEEEFADDSKGVQDADDGLAHSSVVPSNVAAIARLLQMQEGTLTYAHVYASASSVIYPSV